MRTTQPTSRAILGWLSRHWGTLSQVFRDEWQSWADEHPGTDKFGDPFIMSGMNAYVKLNVTAFKMDNVTAVNDQPPIANLDHGITDLTAEEGTNPGEITLNWLQTNTGDAADFVEIRRAGPFPSPGITKYPEEMDFIETVAGTLETYTGAGLQEGGFYWFAIRYVGEDGQTANWHTVNQTAKVTP